MAAEQGLVFLKGQWVEVDHDKLAEALEHWKKVERLAPDGLTFVEGMRLLAGAPLDLSAEAQEDRQQQWSFVHAGQWLGQVLDDLRSPENLQPLQLGADLQATLRPYQQVGVGWLRFLSRLGLGACLADDMGLGKTIQVLALLTARKKESGVRPSLLVVPASLLGNWNAEMRRFTPSLRARFVHPSETSRDELDRLAREPEPLLRQTDLVITTYAMLQRQSWLLDVDWELAVIDEAQAIKNPAAGQTKAVKRLKARARIALTGTPVENRLSDLWSLFDFLCPGLLGSQKKFKDFVKGLNQGDSQRYAPLRRLVQPYILRRLKTDRRIIADLPDKTEVRAFCGLSKRQAALYAKLVDQMALALETLDGMQRRGLVLAYLMRFKQLCNHPSQMLGDGQFRAEDSGKFSRLAEICEEIASRQEKALIFTQFREMAGPLSAFLAHVFGRSGLVLHGNTPVKQRRQLVDRFQREDGPPFFVLSLKAGGTGLNLTQASHVLHFDRWWNPAVENQATDRAFRIGQHRNVLVHKFVCRGTIEEKIDALIEEKTQLAAGVLEGGREQLLTEMSNADLIRLVALDVDRAGG
jgi:non-specific serine/threonine protein kinase